MGQIRLSEELQKQLKEGSANDETKKLFQNFGKHQDERANFSKKKKPNKTVVRNTISDNWLKYGENILKIARESAMKAYEYTVSLRSQKLISRLEILNGLKSDIRTRRVFVPSNAMQLRVQIEDEHRAMLDKIYKNSYTATDNIAKSLRAGQIGQFIAEDEVDAAISDFLILSLVKLDIKNADTFFADILAYKVRSLDECRRFANKIEKYRKTAIDRLCARKNFSAAKELAAFSYKSNLIILSRDGEELDRVTETEKEHLERERIRLIEEERRKQEAAERAAREMEERARVEKMRIKREQAERKRRDEERKRVLEAERDRILRQRYDNLLRLFHVTSIDNLESILANGIYSRVRAERELLSFRDIAAEGALMNHRYINVYGVELDQYARCFFNPLPPMYHMKAKEEERLCVLELWIPFEKVSRYNRYFHNLKIINDADCSFYYPRYYKQSIASSKQDLSSIEVHNLNDISWDSSYEAFERDPNLCKAKRGAEVLIYGMISNVYIVDVYTNEDIELSSKKISELQKYYNSGKPSIVKGEL